MIVAKVKRAVNPHKKKKRKAYKGNPAALLTLGLAGNPYGKKKAVKKRKNTMATKTKKRRTTVKRAKPAVKRRRKIVAKSNPAPRRRRRAARKNPATRTRIVMMKPAHRRRSGARRNPQLFGVHMTPVNIAKAVAGGLVGVTATKTIVPMLPANLTSSPITAAVAAIAVAVAGGWAISKVSVEFGSAFTFGGLMQAGSVLLNAYVPGASQFALQGGGGLREFVPASFAVPQNPIQLTAGTGGAGGPAGRPAINRAYPRPY